jgi:hypothetical protein
VLDAAPAEHAGMASAINNDVARAAGLIAVAVLPALSGITGDGYLDPQALAAGFRTAVLIAAAVCLLGGVIAAVTITNPPRGAPRRPAPEPALHCALEATPLRGAAEPVAPGGRGAAQADG